MTRDEINELEKNLQDGFPCTVECLEEHFTNFYIPILNDPQTQGCLYPNLTNTNVAPIRPIPSGEIGEIIRFERYEADKAKIKIEWNNGMNCDYLLNEKLPFQIRYDLEENPSQLKLALS